MDKKFAHLIETRIWKVHCIIEYRSPLTPYFTTIINSTVNLCAFLNGTDSNPIAIAFKPAVEASIPASYIHACPYYGYHSLNNVTIEVNQIAMQFLSGKYRTTIIVFDNKDDLIFKTVTKAEFADVRPKKRKTNLK